ncbi:putative Trimethyllysine dioxygenase, mitochondrial [Hypsibius exemplaris]|uniref:Trimethyllysine dioxygenase, mitochondrial n=1 Tax=Hypsibius exemplaris TaxID=2072580 RepID=A0A1W0XC20_HYPEX|nr:putative Trimethyllysine dioxygenase, mitochondrial [Hypsibius exemplaris]
MAARNMSGAAQRIATLFQKTPQPIPLSAKLLPPSNSPIQSRFAYSSSSFSTSSSARNLSTQPNIQVPLNEDSATLLSSSFHLSVMDEPEVRLRDRSAESSPAMLFRAEDTLTIQQGQEKLEVPLLWLRDSCGCGLCVDGKTNQRRSWTIVGDARLKEAEIVAGTLRAQWTDGHISNHKLEDLKRTFLVEKDGKSSHTVRRQTWRRQTWRGLPLPVIPHAEVLTDTGLTNLITNIHRYGFGLVNGCGVSEADTEALVRRIAPPMPTTFSPGMWTFTANMARDDTAYGNDSLAPHTDNTYFSNPARLQVFHCLEREAVTGGETVLVDGFQCAEKLQKEDPSAVKTLSTVAQECAYIEPNVCYKWTDTVLASSKLDGTLLEKVRFNMYDRTTRPPLCATRDVNRFYRALKRFADLTQDRENQLLLTLTPGVVVFIDNWRVMHGRTGFSGKRVLTGCYVDSDEFNHACRRANVIP